MNEIMDKVLEMLAEVLECTETGSLKDIDLTQVGLDSIKAIELVVNLETEYDITIDEDDLLLENLDSVDKIVGIVQKYQQN